MISAAREVLPAGLTLLFCVFGPLTIIKRREIWAFWKSVLFEDA